ncbi:MAG: hydrogenase small subunit [Okeania sp. SIO3B3]|nr:hydrogenase small subunit [Okeania sp. SIO3B3]
MHLDRREFMKLCAGTAAGAGISQLAHPAVVQALQTASDGKTPVFWLQGCGCTGCSVSILNTVHPTIAQVLLDIISMRHHPTIMGGEGDVAINNIYASAEANKGKYILMLEGSVPMADERYCIIGERMVNGHHEEYSLTRVLKDLVPGAAACVALGACATYGGIPGAEGNLTGAVGLPEFFKKEGIDKPVVNIAGCAPHPDWMVGTLAYALKYGVPALVEQLDEHGRPKMFFGDNIHDNCPYLPKFNEAGFAKSFNDGSDCKYTLGCKGPITHSDCYKRIWNSGLNWCVENAVCIGCVEPGWPDKFSPFYEEL